jgi:hypothetical protein
MAAISKTSVADKLNLGLQRLHRAGDEPDALGMALTAVHGALEDYLRLWLSQQPDVAREGGIDPLDRGAFSWRDLLAHLDQYGQHEEYLQRLRAQIPHFNGLRQEVAHGGIYSGSRAELTDYAQLISTVVRNGIKSKRSGSAKSQRGSGPARRLHDPIALERLREQKVARLDREWRMKRDSYMVMGNNGRRYLPTTWSSVGMGLFGVVFAIIWVSVTGDSPASARSDGVFAYFPMLGPLAAVIFVGYSIYCYGKATAYQSAEARYRHERAALLSSDNF